MERCHPFKLPSVGQLLSTRLSLNGHTYLSGLTSALRALFQRRIYQIYFSILTSFWARHVPILLKLSQQTLRRPQMFFAMFGHLLLVYLTLLLARVIYLNAYLAKMAFALLITTLLATCFEMV